MKPALKHRAHTTCDLAVSLPTNDRIAVTRILFKTLTEAQRKELVADVKKSDAPADSRESKLIATAARVTRRESK